MRAKFGIECVSALPNWTPMPDAVVVDAGSRPVRLNPDGALISQSHGRLFACAGRANHGTITEFRHGVRAWVDIDVNYYGGATRMWCIPDPERQRTVCVVSFPLHTELLYMSDELGTVEPKSESDADGLDLTTGTVTAGAIGDVVVQATSNSIVATRLSSLRGAEQSQLTQRCAEGEIILDAIIYPPLTSVLVAVAKEGDVELHQIKLDVADE